MNNEGTFFMSELAAILKKHRTEYHTVVDFDPVTDKLFHFNFTSSNAGLGQVDLADTAQFSSYINQQLQQNGARYGIGGYGEDRTLYRRSQLFDGEEVRTVHLGIDIWGPEGTAIYLPLGGVIHSFAFNDHFGDYGATIIMQHQLETLVFFTLYGHLSLDDIAGLKEGKFMSRGEKLAHFGGPAENGNWPPHLHFQLIDDIRLNKGDYPGVCTTSQKEGFLSNCPDPDLLLNMMQFAIN